ncbi:hypothetical protein [Lacticaseibacillus paracasei]|uniref:hypothetical protein n=1 Tax=Lacticaseibacillus paracasei TaxID=1597 RepID=UPI002157DD17|nr:hypothetical protein [Lacticaseibacillus paracasei]UVD35762.1 hypothetical protein MUB27_04560 [Lacticaseibacillus paracasei]UVD36435.1 hypothetical protein MUB27_14780 [Lacticaseibacillus paracasei]
MTKHNMMKAAHAIAREIVNEVGDYQIALSIALKEVWRQAKMYGKKRFGDVSVLTASQRLVTLKKDRNANIYGVPAWIIKKNLSQDEVSAVLTCTAGISIVRETEKAQLVRFDTDFGKIEMWTPKSVLVA